MEYAHNFPFLKFLLYQSPSLSHEKPRSRSPSGSLASCSRARSSPTFSRRDHARSRSETFFLETNRGDWLFVLLNGVLERKIICYIIMRIRIFLFDYKFFLDLTDLRCLKLELN